MTKSNQTCECGHILGAHAIGCLREGCPCVKFVAKREVPDERD